MANSSLATYTKITNNHSGKRTKKITKITVHMMAAVWSGKQCADYFYQLGLTGERQASSNYCIGNGGDIALSVPEDCRAWTSSNEANDQCAVTIEVGNSSLGGEYPVSAAAWNSLVNLCVDICKRNGIRLTYTGTSTGTLTEHLMFASTNCPGPYLHARMGQLAKEVNAKLDGQSTQNKPAAGSGKTWWNYDAILQAGDTISSRSCKIAVYPGTSSAIKNGCVYVPDLGGLVPLEDVEEANDTKDGAMDNYLANTNARVWLREMKVEAVDPQADLVKVNGYWVKPGPLCRKETA